MKRIHILLIFTFSAFSISAQVGCKEITQTIYSENLFFRVETDVTFCYCSEEEKKQINEDLINPIQKRLDEIKKDIESNLNKYKNDFHATFHACNEYVKQEEKINPYQHIFRLEKNKIKIEKVYSDVIVRMCFYKELDQNTIKEIENKIIKNKE